MLARRGQLPLPIGQAEVRVLESNVAALIQTSGEPTESKCLRASEDVLARVLEIPARAIERLLGGFEVLRESYRRNSRNRHGPTRDTSPALDHLESEAVGHGIALGFVHLHHHLFAVLGGDLAARIDFSPVKDARLVEAAFGREHLIFRERTIRL